MTRLDIASELTTPTGAALLTTLSQGEWHHLPERLLNTGTGHGTKHFENWPNILRAYLLETEPEREPAEILETDVDDETPEVLASLAEQLMEQGALDVIRLPVYMKKGRLGTRIQIVCRVAESDQLIDTVFRESSTLGIRITPVSRCTLRRDKTEVETPWGTVPAKRIERPHGVEITPEADAVRALAEQQNVPVRDIMQAAHQPIGNDEA